MVASKAQPFDCPVCGEEVPAGARACPQCGACEKSGWSEDSAADGLDLPGEECDYDEFIREEFGGSPKKSSVQWIWWTIAVLLLLALGLTIFL